MIYVCSLLGVDGHAADLKPARLISIISPEEQPPTPLGLEPREHLRVSCHDIVAPCPLEILPDRRHVKQIIAFARQWEPSRPILVHCQAGRSRSTAAALIVYAVHFPEAIEYAAAHLRRAAPHVHPNPLIVALGDELLGLGGRLTAAVEAMGPPALEAADCLIHIPPPDALGAGSRSMV